MEVKPGYKRTEVGIIPEDWNVSSVGREYEIKLGKMLDAEKNSGVLKPYLGNRSVQWNRIDIIDLPTVRLSRSDLERFRLKKGDLLVCEGGEVGRAAIWEAPLEECYYQKALHRLRPLLGFSSPLMAAYLRHWAESGLLANYVTQTSIAHLPREKLMEVPMPVPSQTEQRAIAEALSDVDGLLGGLDRLIAKKRELKQAAMQQLLTGKTRLPGFHGEWEVERLDELGRCFAGGTPSTTRPEYWDGSVLWLPSGRVQNNILAEPSESETRITEKGLAESAAKRIRPWSVLIAITGATCANIALLQFEAAANQSVVALETYEGTDARFIFYALLMERGQILSRQSGSAQGGINLKTVKSIEVRYPQYEEQAAIAKVLSEMDAELAALEQRREKTLALKQAMMQELLTGRIRLVPPAANVIPADFKAPVPQAETKPASGKSHNWAINEAVVVAVLAKTFGSEKFPLGRKRCTKLSYLLHRHVEHVAEGYLKKAAGPYNPAVKYRGPEGIAQKNGYVRSHKNGHFSGYIAAEKIAQAEDYFQKWYGKDVLHWLEQFRHHKNDDLELLATVDMAMEELHRAGKEISLATVRNLIASEPEWVPKLDRAVFSDPNITAALTRCSELFPR